MDRISQNEKEELVLLNEQLDDPHAIDTSALISTLGKIFTKCDSYDPLEDPYQTIEYRHDIYKSIWNEAKELRSSGKLIEFAKTIECPVLAIHGNYDPHPLNGVKEPCSQHLKKFKIISLDHCGHCPWIERQAKDEFYHILKEEIPMN